MFRMYRSFNSVGQGAFYTEVFGINNTKNFVYDCGSLNNMLLIQEKIRNVFDKDEAIEAVFISHFDDDHINGLEYLLNYCNVKKLFIPLLQETNKALMLLQLITNGISQHSFLYALLMNPESVVDEHTQIIYVDEYENNDEINVQYESDDEINVQYESDDDFFINNENTTNRNIKIRSGKKCVLDNFQWLYVPYNYKNEKRHEMLIKAFKDNGIPIPKSADDVPQLYMNYFDTLKQIYLSKKITGDINTNSLVIYSGPLVSSKEFIGLYFLDCKCLLNYLCDFCHDFYKVGCLYTGDYDASGSNKWEELKTSYLHYWEQIGTWQIPHHGAKSSYNPEIARSGVHTAIVSAGISNQYNHPHEKVTRDLILNDINLHVVTENIDSQAHFLIRD